jgi:hypothetical protein
MFQKVFIQVSESAHRIAMRGDETLGEIGR